MTLSGLIPALRLDPAIDRLAAAAQAVGRPRLDLTAVPGLRAPALAAIAAEGRLVLAVTATGREAEDLAAALRSLLGEAAVHYARFGMPHHRELTERFLAPSTG